MTTDRCRTGGRKDIDKTISFAFGGDSKLYNNSLSGNVIKIIYNAFIVLLIS